MKRASLLTLVWSVSIVALVACGGADDPAPLGPGGDAGAEATTITDGDASGGDAATFADASALDGSRDAISDAASIVDASNAGDSSPVDAGQDAASCIGSIDIVVDNGPLQHWTSECLGELYANQYSTPLGYLYRINGGDPHGLKIVGCKSGAQNSEGIALYANNAVGVGTYVVGSPKYSDGNGMVLGKGTDPFNVVVTTFGAQGALIEGTFAATSTKNNVSHTLSGSFHVCRAPDYTGP